jgi:hypothetical protein
LLAWKLTPPDYEDLTIHCTPYVLHSLYTVDYEDQASVDFNHGFVFQLRTFEELMDEAITISVFDIDKIAGRLSSTLSTSELIGKVALNDLALLPPPSHSFSPSITHRWR